MAIPDQAERAPTATTLAAWASTLELGDVPERVVAFAKSQVLSMLAAALTSLDHPIGARVKAAFGPPLQDDPQRTAYALAALTMCLDYDDTLYAGHLSHSTVNVPLAYSRSLALDGRSLLTAVLAANETAARIAAASTLGRFRGQSASHPHLCGAVAARLRAEAAPAERWVDALGLALAFPPWTLRPAFVGIDAKLLTAASSIRLGLDACDAAAAGIRGRADLIERDGGFLDEFSDVPLPRAVTARLGERWHTETLSFKVHPTSTGVHASVDAAVALHPQLAADADAIEEVVVHTNLLTVRVDETAKTYLDGPESPVSALQYSVSYNVATALLTGSLDAGDFTTPAVADPARWALADKVTVEHDYELTGRALLATTPLGEALREAGPRAVDWLLATGGIKAAETPDGEGPPPDVFGTPSETFEDADKAIGARVVVRMRDGRELVEEQITAIGASGPDTRARHPELMRSKFLSAGGSAEVADLVARLEDATADELAGALTATFAGR